jgi:hypothetical protein
VLAAAWLVTAASDPPVVPSCDLVPGWTQDGPARTHDAENLFEYMNGNAEGYILYGFEQMHGVTCKKGEVTFVIDISDMGTVDFSYGLFTANRDLRQPQAAVGMGGQIVPRRLIFAKGKYYVEIAANPEGDHTTALKEWAAALEKAVPGAAMPPAALSWFPTEKQQSLRLVPESVLGLRLLKRGYLAQYEFGKAFVVFDDSASEAEEVMKQLRKRFTEVVELELEEGGFQGTDRYLGRVCMFRRGRLLGGYAISRDGFDPVPLSRKLAAAIGSWR